MVRKGTSSESSTSTAEPPLAKTQVLTIWCVKIDDQNARGHVLQCHLTGWSLISSSCYRFNRFTTGIYLTLPYTLSVFMVRSFLGSSASEERVGRNTGILVSLCASASCVHWSLSTCLTPASLPPVVSLPVVHVQAAAASVGQTLSAFMWGAVSDRVGRKVSPI